MGHVTDSFPLKPRNWKRFLDDTNVSWPHGKENLDHLLTHLNSQSDHIKFTMETQDNNPLPFFDVLITRKNDVSLTQQVYLKRTHTDKYLHASSHHVPSQKLGILKAPATRVVQIVDNDHLDKELNFLWNVLENNGYNIRDINRAFKKALEKKI